MKYCKATLENGRLVETGVREIDQSTLTSDCWLIQFDGLAACGSCEMKGKSDCGGGVTLARLQQEAPKHE